MTLCVRSGIVAGFSQGAFLRGSLGAHKPCMIQGRLHSLHVRSHAVLPNITAAGQCVRVLLAREAPSRFGILRQRAVFDLPGTKGRSITARPTSGRKCYEVGPCQRRFGHLIHDACAAA
jgi:hypothetical protein